MAYQNELTEIAMSELKAHGIRAQCRDTKGGHIEIAWQVVPEKEVRRVILAKTPGDWRSRMNTRAEVRRLLRADNVQLIMSQKKPKKAETLKVEQALSLPAEVLPIPDQVAAMRGEMADLTELMMRLTKIVTATRDIVMSYVPKPVEAAPQPSSSRSVKLTEYLSHDRWVNTSTLPRDTGLKPEQIKLKLAYLKRQGEVEIFRGQVKLKAPEPGKAVEKKLHWKTARKLAREAAEAEAREVASRAANDHANGHTVVDLVQEIAGRVAVMPKKRGRPSRARQGVG